MFAQFVNPRIVIRVMLPIAIGIVVLVALVLWSVGKL